MFQHFIEKLRQRKAVAKRKERQQRFVDILTDHRCNQLAPIFTSIAQKDPTLTDG
jgi:hemerythrin superfamily protein